MGRLILGIVLAGVIGLAAARGTEPQLPEYRPALDTVLTQAGKDKEEKDKKKDGKKGDKKDDKKPLPPPVDFTQAPPRSEAPLGFNPNMIGDYSGVTGLRRIMIPATAAFFAPLGPPVSPPSNVIALPPGPVPPGFTIAAATVSVPVAVRVPIGGRGPFKIGENESPRPQDRVFFTYNFYNDTEAPVNGSELSRVRSIILNRDGVPTPATLTIPGVAPPRLDLHREVIGFEKTCLDGAASIGLRVPLFQQTGNDLLAEQDFGDISVIVKVAAWQDRETGSLISTGLMVTAPTGPDVNTVAGNIHPTLLQPFVGYYFQTGNLFFQGFTSLVVPTDSRDVTLFFNDIGVGYVAYQAPDRFLSSLTPTLEVHVATPLNHRSVLEPISAEDGVALTGGIHLGLGPRSVLTLGVATPLTGPRPFDVEAVVQFNLRF